MRIVFILWLVGLCACTAPIRYHGPRSDHFDGQRFHNLQPTDPHNITDFLKWRLAHSKTPWTKEIKRTPATVFDSNSSTEQLRVTFVGHATTLVQMNGVSFLTDPIWSDRCSPFSWAGPKRVQKPGIEFDQLPKIDFILISHNHYDHMDLPTLKRLTQSQKIPIFVGLGNSVILSDAKIPGAIELDWWQTQKLSETEITYTPAQHFSSRWLHDRDMSLWGGFVVKTKDFIVFFAGDTGYSAHFREIGERLGQFDLALLPIGAYEPRWFMKPVHMNPEEAVLAHLDLKSKQSLAIHHSTFQLTDEGMDEPAQRLSEASKSKGIDSFHVIGQGESFLLDSQPTKRVAFTDVKNP